MVADDRVLVIIPARNEEDALPNVLKGLAAVDLPLDVCVVDDGSTDATAEVARAGGATVLSLPFNLGIGGALRAGFRYAVQEGYQRAVQFDGDGQHDPAHLPTLLAALDGGADLVIGSRFAAGGDYAVGRVRGQAMGVLRVAVRLATRRSFSDTSSGFRAFSRPMLVAFARWYPVDYMESVEALIVACSSGYQVEEVPVRMQLRTDGVASTRRFRLAYHYLRLLLVMGLSTRRRNHLRPVTGR